VYEVEAGRGGSHVDSRRRLFMKVSHPEMPTAGPEAEFSKLKNKKGDLWPKK
jgi:hypothetical protein